MTKKNGKNKNPLISTRLLALQNQMDKQISRIENNENTDLIEVIYMYFDEK